MISEIIKQIFQEDLASEGDVTSKAIFGNETAEFTIVSKDKGILCGINLIIDIFDYVDNQTEITKLKEDGDYCDIGDEIAIISGKVLSILQAERIALNYLSHLSGIATKTAKFVEATEGRSTILDTRKTIPGLRVLQKYAVKCGGGNNHRMGLYDMVMIKDNHIDAAGSITAAVEKIRQRWGIMFTVEVETRNLAEVQEALDCGANIIMLDNMDNEMMAEAVKLVGKKAKTEASGNMTLERIEEVSKTGVDYISIGALTHTVKAFDFSLKKRKK